MTTPKTKTSTEPAAAKPSAWAKVSNLFVRRKPSPQGNAAGKVPVPTMVASTEFVQATGVTTGNKVAKDEPGKLENTAASGKEAPKAEVKESTPVTAPRTLP